jgi:two-component system CheB/CheR fusion protein
MVMIIFTDVKEVTHQKVIGVKGGQALAGSRQSEFEKELQHTREEMQNTLEEMQTSQEELKSANEELQSTNEELQSTNEELTTSKEEMQSLNEELQTVNAELQSKVDDFALVNNDMKNLLNSTDIATLFLDKELNIRRYTNEATKIFKLIQSDIGRPITDQVSDLIYNELADDAREVLRSLVFIQKQIPTLDKRWFSVRIMPYRTYDDRIDGIVITFVNNSDIKHLEGELQETEQMHQLILNTSSDVIVRLSTDWKILEFNPSAEKFFGKRHKDVMNQNYFELFVPAKEQKPAETEMESLLKQGKNARLKMQVLVAGGTSLDIEWYANVLFNNLKSPAGIMLFAKNREIGK